MADRTIKPDATNDLVLQNNGGSKKIEITNSGNIEVTGAVDLQGNELILDADGDTSITADTDDQVDVKIAGTDKFSVDANGIRLGPKAGSSTSHNIPYKITVGPYNWSQSNDEICEITMGSSVTGGDDGEIKFYTAQNVNTGGTLTERLHIKNAGDVEVKTGNVVIGTAGQGITFGGDPDGRESFATSGDRTLYDYEQGTYQTGLNDSSGNETTAKVTGYYTKIGDLCFCGFQSLNNINTTGLTSGDIACLKLPFTTTSRAGSHTVRTDNLTWPSGSGSITGTVEGNLFKFRRSTSGSSDSGITVSNFTSGTTDIVDFAIIYKVS